MQARSIQMWFDEYGESHQNRTNKMIHWICVPTIYFCVVGLLASIPPAELPWIGQIPWAKITVGLALVLFYLPRSITLTIGMGYSRTSSTSGGPNLGITAAIMRTCPSGGGRT